MTCYFNPYQSQHQKQKQWDLSGITLLITHANCPDGQSCAALMANYIQENGRAVNSIRFHYIQPKTSRKDVPLLEPTDKVLICDVGFSSDILREIKSQVEAVFVMDHHHTWFKEWTNTNLFEEIPIRFENETFAAKILWKELYGDKNVPSIIQHLDDQDLMKKQMPNHFLFRARMMSFPCHIKAYQSLLKISDSDLERFVNSGKEPWNRLCEKMLPVYQRNEQHVLRIPNYKTGNMVSFKVMYLDSLIYVNIKKSFGNNNSTICEYLPKNELSSFAIDRCGPSYEIVIVSSYYKKSNTTHFTLTSRASNGPNVEEIAALYGGGGHVHFASIVLSGKLFRLPELSIPTIHVSKKPIIHTKQSKKVYYKSNLCSKHHGSWSKHCFSTTKKPNAATQSIIHKL